MLTSQKNFSEYLNKLDSLMQGSEISWDQTLIGQIKNTPLLLPVIGAFSAGKSSLLNTFMGMDILPVGIAPETELATELHFSQESYLLAIRHDGNEERLAVEDLTLVNKKSAEYSHLRLYINSPALEAIAPLILVDMPGYGSSLENHNKALAYYLPRGVHFIVVTSIEEGTVTQSVLRHLDTIKVYGGDFSFILSKTNLRAPEQASEITDYINEQLQLYFGADKQVIPLDNQASDTFNKVLFAINPDLVFHNLFIDRLKDQNIDLINQINFASNVIKNSKNVNDNAFRALEQALDGLIQQRNKTQEDMKFRFSTPLITRCINAIDRDLNGQIDRLANFSTTKNAATALEREISEIISSNLTRTLKQEMDQISAEMIQELAVNLTKNNEMLDSLDHNWAKNIADKTEAKLKAVSGFIETMSERLPGKEDAGKVYRLFSTVLAITTSVISPVLELVIVFLPDIIRLLSSINAEEKARKNLLNSVFPGIKSELRNLLPEIVDEQLSNLLKSVSDEFEEQINQQRILITRYQQEREMAQETIDKQLEIFQDLSVELKALATSYLYC
ncbi:dynamin family protein [Rahnella victoriana]|uniref:dynamin family protein n=1 Tax=Rahnella victoriana TaxID=1510570 RepID=UPI00103CB408|nr:dynamin family protein [Rahnella victoriana]TBX37047.1 GTPase [Rahnella victoriana]